MMTHSQEYLQPLIGAQTFRDQMGREQREKLLEICVQIDQVLI